MRLFALLALAACYHGPSLDAHCAITCSTGTCPAGLECIDGFCATAGEACQPTFTQVTAGVGFACAIDTLGAAWCWGLNDHHQVDASDDHRVTTPRRVDADHHWDVLDAGGGQVCGLSGGALFCWGDNTDGRLDGTIPGDLAGAHAIAAVDGPASWTAISAGHMHVCAIGVDGSLYCWGENDQGELGDGSTMKRSAPVKVMTTLSDWTTVTAGSQHTCGISASMGILCWGDNYYHQIGPNAGTTDPVMTPTPVPTVATPTALEISDIGTCAIAGGDLYCWGADSSGELGTLPITPTNIWITPALASDAHNWTQLAGSSNYACGLHDDGVLACWGTTASGGLGAGVWTDKRAFDDDIATGVSQLAVGYAYDIDPVTAADPRDLELACTITGDVTSCWGDDRFGQLGDGGAMVYAPTEVSGGHAFTQFSAHGEHACGIEGSSTWCWGSTTFGEATGVLSGVASAPCGPGVVCDVPAPTEILFANNATSIATGDLHSCAVRNGGDDLICWGYDTAGQLGSGGLSGARTVDLTPLGSGTTWGKVLPTGGQSQCATDDFGVTDCWGSFATLFPMPQPILAGAQTIASSTFPGVSAGLPQTVCFTTAGNQLYCTGDNTRDQYGNGQAPSPCSAGVCQAGNTCTTCAVGCGDNVSGVNSCAALTGFAHVAGDFTQLAMSSQNESVCAVTPDGKILCWGDNTAGQTGSPSIGTVTATPQDLLLRGCTRVAMGTSHACGLCGGVISCWGDNHYAQLGVGMETARETALPQPIASLPGDPWIDVEAGANATCAQSTMGHVQCWGQSAHGMLGIGTGNANLPRVLAVLPP